MRSKTHALRQTSRMIVCGCLLNLLVSATIVPRSAIIPWLSQATLLTASPKPEEEYNLIEYSSPDLYINLRRYSFLPMVTVEPLGLNRTIAPFKAAMELGGM